MHIKFIDKIYNNFNFAMIKKICFFMIIKQLARKDNGCGFYWANLCEKNKEAS